MRHSGFVLIILYLFHQGIPSLARGYQEQHLAQDVSIADQCNGYCFTVLQPFLDHFTQLKVAGDANNEMKDKINSLEVTINNLQSQLLNSVEQMTGLKEQVKEISAVKVHQTAESLHDTCPNGPSSGIFQIKIEAMEEPFQVPCVPSSSGWMVIQRRIDGSTDFNRTWNDYKLGFGNLRDNFFLGLEKIHLMTKNQSHELFIQLQDIKGATSFAHYTDFKIGSEKEAYKLKSVGEYSGTAGDSLTEHHLNMKFSTLDRDNDIDENRYCADVLGGGWWFSKCGHSSLNGKYYADGKSEASQRDGILWGSWQHYDYTNSVTRAQMMIRPTSYNS